MSFEGLFLFLALEAILFNGAELLWPSWTSHRHNVSSFRLKSFCCYRASFGSRQPKVWDEMSIIDFQDGSCGGHRIFYWLI